MPKEKVESIVVGKIHGDKQEVYINGNYHEYKWDLSPYDIIDILSEFYDFSSQDEKDLEVLW